MILVDRFACHILQCMYIVPLTAVLLLQGTECWSDAITRHIFPVCSSG